jgi:hypothetical protein
MSEGSYTQTYKGETDNTVASTSKTATKTTKRGRGRTGAASETKEEDNAGQGHEKIDGAETKPRRGRPRKDTVTTTPTVQKAIKEEAEILPVATTALGPKKKASAPASRSKASTIHLNGSRCS